MPVVWTADDLFDLLVTRVGLPPSERPASLNVTFTDIGLDSLAYLQLQAEVQSRLGVELPADLPPDYTLEKILADVNAAVERQEVA